MADLLVQIALVAGITATFMVGPSIALAFLHIRKRRARARRRSPVGIALLRPPGHTLREQLEELQIDVLTRVYTLSALPLILLAIFLAQAHVRGYDGMRHLIPVYVGIAVLIIVFTVRRLMKDGGQLDRLRAGYDAAQAVGQELDQLMREGASVFHDFPADDFNIDHIVKTRAGVFAVETKGFTKPAKGSGRAAVRVGFDGRSLAFPTWSTSAPLEQAERQARWLSQWAAERLGLDAVQVEPVVALPGWFVDRRADGPVRVLNGRELGWLLQGRLTAALSDQDVKRLSAQVEERCRTVEPRYGRAGG